MAITLKENFVAIFSKEGTDTEAVSQIFKDETGADDVQVSYDYITDEDGPDKYVSFFVHGADWSKLVGTKLRMNLRQVPNLPASHYMCME